MNRLRTSNFTRHATILSLLLLIGPSRANGQFEVIFADPVYVQKLGGHVQDPTGGEIEDAKIELLDVRTGKLIASTMTNSKGDFAFKESGRSSYKLKIARPGFNTVIVTIKILKKNTSPAVFTLPIAT